jgi:glycosyltransferase involved in cell wall biosynthesis
MAQADTPPATTILIASYGDECWSELAHYRAVPSTVGQGAEVIVHHEPNGNVASSRNGAAARANSEWLCFLDADDELAPGYITAMERDRARYKGDDAVLFTPAVSYVRNGRHRPARFLPPMPLHSANWLVIGTVVSRRLFTQVGGFRNWPHGLEDWDLWARISRTGCRISRVRRAVYVAHWNDDSKHHQLQRDKAAYIAAYEQVAASHREEQG